jgi:threonine ammonia-lyase medium form
MASDSRLVTLDDILASRPLVTEKLHRTPMLASTALGERTGVKLHFKAEMFQKTGSFKPRGILNRIYKLTDAEKSRGVISVSAGNAAQAVAYAAAQLGIPATVVMPEAATQSKVDATKGYGANVIQHGTGKDLLPKMREIQAEQGQIFIHPFDDLDVIAGHGTLGLEILEDVPDVDTVIVPVGGGGLISGIAAALKYRKPSVKVIGVEPVGSQAMTKSLEQNAVYHLDKSNTIADGLAAPFAGEHTLRHVKQFVDEVVLVTDDDIIEALRLILERCKILPEPSAAASFAALLMGKVSASGTVVCVLSGGNVDRSLLKTIL